MWASMKPSDPSRACSAGAAPTITESPMASTGIGGGGGGGGGGAGAVVVGGVATPVGRGGVTDVGDTVLAATGPTWRARNCWPARRLWAMGSGPGGSAGHTVARPDAG